MAWAKHRRVEFDYEADHDYPYVVTAWFNVGGFNCGDRFTDQVGEILVDEMKKDGIKVGITLTHTAEAK